MKQTKGKALSRILAVASVFAMILALQIGVMPVDAAGEVCEIVGGSTLTGTQYMTVKDAVDAINSDGGAVWGSIVMLDDSVENTAITSDKSIIMNLAGHTLTVTSPGTALDLAKGEVNGPGAVIINGVAKGKISILGGAAVTINGDVNGYVEIGDAGTTVDITGDAVAGSGESFAINAFDGAIVNIGGSVMANDVFYAVRSDGATVTITGDIVAIDADAAAIAENSGTITIGGTLTITGGGTFIEVDSVVKTASQNDATSIKSGYKQYSGGTPTSYVWIRLGTYTLTVSAGTGGSVSTPGGTYTENDAISVTAIANSGYYFTGWTVTGVTLANLASATAAFSMPANNVTLTANFAPITNQTSTPATGDNSNMALWLLLLVVSPIAFVYVVVSKRRRLFCK